MVFSGERLASPSAILCASSVSPARAKANAARIWESWLEARAIAASSLLSYLGQFLSSASRRAAFSIHSAAVSFWSLRFATSAALADSSLAFVGRPA